MSLNEHFRVAAVQMVSGASVDDNLEQAWRLIADAVQQGAKLVALPEYFCFMGRRDKDKLSIKETAGHGPIQQFLAQCAREHGIWLVGGTLPLESPDSERIYNSCLVFDPEGNQIGRYDKIHLFGFKKGEESYDESVSIRPGENAVQMVSLPFGQVGLSICYDLRFPELFRQMKTVQLVVLPSAFTYTTGAAHWEILLRARAIENQCYVLAPAQGGKHENGRRTWGHSMLVDPWGDVVDVKATGPGIAIGNIELQRIDEVRTALPAWSHRTL
ncbi:carbon-nitrogen hydrolase family protein [Alcaligenaceae bacterium]|nr:carbon-nitrogen hydrolase family protein [Alcaligenaceae bacterium]